MQLPVFGDDRFSRDLLAERGCRAEGWCPETPTLMHTTGCGISGAAQEQALLPREV